MNNHQQCKCGQSKGLSNHIVTESGWITLTQPLCAKCRIAYYEEVKDSFEALKNAAKSKPCKHYDCGWCYAPKSAITNAVQGACVNPKECAIDNSCKHCGGLGAFYDGEGVNARLIECEICKG